ncbi:MAG: NAD-dependent epimerase/dehydratase family protein [Proteobacteria bacterium]|nr:NAD-dependent epimerase/dehydratase family protein [Pseudomonadota bacterium]
MKVLVTGATGFLGRQLVEQLVARGDDVTGLVWPAAACPSLQGRPVRLLVGDIRDLDAVTKAVQGQDVVFHCAGKVDDWGPRDEYYMVNVEGTRMMLEASRAAGVKHFIHISSLVVVGLPKKNPIDETAPYTNNPANFYMETKLVSEKMVLEYGTIHGLAVTIIRPGILWGPGDTTMLPRMERLAKSRLLVPIGGGGNILCLTHVANLVDALLLAAQSEKAHGQVYHITDTESVSCGQYFRALACAIGFRQPPISIPYPVVYAAAFFLELGAAALRAAGIAVPPLLTRYGIALWSATMIAPPTKAQQQLGYRQHVFFKEGMKNLAAEYAHKK